MNDPAPVELRLLDTWRVLVRRRPLVLACLAAVVGIVLLLTIVATPLYRATATLQIQRQGPEVLTHKDVVSVDPSWSDYQDFYQTQYKILQSRAVLHLAAERLDLLNRPEFVDRREPPISRLMTWVRERVSPKVEPDSSDPLDRAIDYLDGGLDIQPVRSSYLVKVSFTDADAALARDAADAIAWAYQEFTLNSRYKTTGQASDFLVKQVQAVQQEVAEKERELQQKSADKAIVNLGDAPDISAQALADLNTQLVAARARLALAEARRASVRDASPDALPDVLTSQLILNLKSKYAEVERQRSQLAERFRDDWPALRQIDEELRQARERLELETQSLARQVREVASADHARARGEVESLSRRVDEQKLEVQRFNRDAIDVASLKSEIETRRRFLGDLVNRQSETEVSDRLRTSNASNIVVVDKAELPKGPVYPRKRFNLLVGVILGLLAGVGAAFLADHIDNTVKGEQDIERTAELPVFGHVPLFEPLRAVPEKSGTVATAESQHPIGLASWLDPRSGFSEAFRNLRTSLLLASPDHPPRVIVVTSCEPGDGKSTVSVNLAIVLTQLGRRVLLVDADLRRPRLHRIFGVSSSVGLSSLLTGNATFEDVVQDCTMPGLSLIPSGPLPPNPSELLQSVSLQTMLDRSRARDEWDHVILDSPPAVQVADSLILGGHADATILVVRAAKTARESLVAGVTRLRQGRVHISGAVLNAVREHDGYYYHYKYRYYRTGEGGSETPVRRFARFRRKKHSQSA